MCGACPRMSNVAASSSANRSGEAVRFLRHQSSISRICTSASAAQTSVRSVLPSKTTIRTMKAVWRERPAERVAMQTSETRSGQGRIALLKYVRNDDEPTNTFPVRRIARIAYPLRRYLNGVLTRWPTRKYKKRRHHFRRAEQWLLRISRRDPRLFAHWQLGAQRGFAAGAV